MNEIVSEERRHSPPSRRRLLSLELLTRVLVTTILLYFGMIALAIWGPFPRSFRENLVFWSGMGSLFGGLIFTANFLGEFSAEKEDSTRTAYVVDRGGPSATSPKIFPRAVPGEKPSDRPLRERGYTSPIVDAFGFSMIAAGLLLIISSSIY